MNVLLLRIIVNFKECALIENYCLRKKLKKILVHVYICFHEYCWLPAKHSEEYDEGKLGLPPRYDKRYRVNIGIVSKNVEEFLRRGKLPGKNI